MKDKTYDNADSFSMSFDQEWQKVKCDDLNVKIDKVISHMSNHPFVSSQPDKARKIAEFRIFSLKKFH